MLTVGLTGGIGAGKSTVASRLAALGAVVVDADALARQVVEPGTPGLGAVVAAFGGDVLLPDGALDRAALGRAVFADEAARLRLEAILHPRIAARTAEVVAATPPDRVLVHDVPLLVEKGMGARYHLVVVVDADEHERVDRLVHSRGIGADDARARIAAQSGRLARREAADVWLDNSGDPQALSSAVEVLWHARLVPFEANVRARRPAPRPGVVRVVAPDPTWPEQAARLVARIRTAVGSAASRVDHHGSTAVAGLPAKDVLDLQVVVPDLDVADMIREPLETAGFARMGGDWWDETADGARVPKRVHTACDPGRAVNLHVRVGTSPHWRWVLVFRDWLRAHPDEARSYAAAKLTGQGSGIEEYMAAKGPWVGAALARALRWAQATGWEPDA